MRGEGGGVDDEILSSRATKIDKDGQAYYEWDKPPYNFSFDELTPNTNYFTIFRYVLVEEKPTINFGTKVVRMVRRVQGQRGKHQ